MPVWCQIQEEQRHVMKCLFATSRPHHHVPGISQATCVFSQGHSLSITAHACIHIIYVSSALHFYENG